MTNTQQQEGLLFGFDFGTKRIGVAIGESVNKTARPLAILPVKNGVPAWESLEKLINKWKPYQLIVGLPLNMDGTEQALTSKARTFAESLHLRYHLPVQLIDERLTTKDARERLFEKGGYKALQSGQVDAIAAQLILQNWFAEHK